MPVWAWIVLGVAVAAFIAAIVAIAAGIWRRAVRGYLRQLIARREEARAIRRALDELIGGLQRGSDEQRSAFADDSEAVERYSLADLSERAHALSDELNAMALPKRVIPAAEALADACEIVSEEANRARQGSIGDESLEALASTDLDRVSRAFSFADAQIAALSAEYGVNEQDVQVKGLYI